MFEDTIKVKLPQLSNNRIDFHCSIFFLCFQLLWPVGSLLIIRFCKETVSRSEELKLKEDTHIAEASGDGGYSIYDHDYQILRCF